MKELNITKDFTETPGPRFIIEGPKSGQLFRNELLEPMFITARDNGEKLLVDLDGGYGYGTSFLEESFGGLARIYGEDQVLSTIELKSDDLPTRIEQIINYIKGKK